MPKLYYWWAVATIDGKRQLILAGPDFGSDGGESAARSHAIEVLSGYDFTLHRFPTRTTSEASAFYRGKRLNDGEGLKASTQRLGHERSVNRLKARIARRRMER